MYASVCVFVYVCMKRESVCACPCKYVVPSVVENKENSLDKREIERFPKKKKEKRNRKIKVYANVCTTYGVDEKFRSGTRKFLGDIKKKK